MIQGQTVFIKVLSWKKNPTPCTDSERRRTINICSITNKKWRPYWEKKSPKLMQNVSQWNEQKLKNKLDNTNLTDKQRHFGWL